MFKEKVIQDKALVINTLLKAKDVCEILKISRSMAYGLMQRGEIPTVKFGRCRRVRSEDLIKYIKNNTYQMNQYSNK